MNTFDQYVKHKLKARHYLRYADDFVLLSDDKNWLESLQPSVEQFLLERLRLYLHPNKVFISSLASGVDFLGWVHFPDHRVLRTIARRRMLKRIVEQWGNQEATQSYLGLLRHGNTRKLRHQVNALAGEIVRTG